jgi:hypothetical protein
MFICFFNDYKSDAKLGNVLDWLDKALVFITIILYVAFAFISCVIAVQVDKENICLQNIDESLSYVLGGFFICSFVIIVVKNNKFNHQRLKNNSNISKRKQNKKYLEKNQKNGDLLVRHKARIIDLVDLLKHNNYNLYSKESIDWLIDCCESILSSKPKWLYFIPGTGVVVGIIIAETKNIFQNYLFKLLEERGGIQIISMLAVVVLSFLAVDLLVSKCYRLFKGMFIYERLRDDLKYIKTQLSC